MSERVVLSDRQVDLVTRDVTQAGYAVVRLTTKEAELLGYLASRPNVDVPRGDLLRDVWGYAPNARTRAVDFTVRRLRQKVEFDPTDPAHIRTVHGVGYRFCVEQAEPVVVVEVPVVTPGVVSPPQRPTFGRSREVKAVNAAFGGGARLVTLLGPVGVGKSHLAREIASGESDRWSGAWWCELSEDDTVVDAVCEALGLPVDHEAPSRAGRALRRGGRCLLVLDSVDGERDGLVVSSWLAGAPSLRVLVTARARLGIRGEHVLSLGSLDVEASRALLVGMGVDDSVAAALVEQLNGLPLALELAARTGVESAAGEGRDAIFEALDVAWARLDEACRRAWTQLCTCPGGVDLDTAERLLGERFIDRLEVLQDQGLVRAVDGGASLRFEQLESVRRYGLQRLGQAKAAVQRSELRAWLDGRWWTQVRDAVRIERDLLRQIEAERVNLRATWRARDNDPVVAGRAAVLLAMSTSAHLGRSIERLELAEGLVTDASDALCVLRVRARLRRRAGRLGAALDDARRAALMASDLGALALEGVCLAEAARCLRLRGQLYASREVCERSRDRLSRSGLRTEAGLVMGLTGQVLHDLGQASEADRALRDAVHLARIEGLAAPLVGALTTLGTLYRHQGQLVASERAYDEALAHVGLVHDPDLRHRLDRERGCLHLERGELNEASRLLHASAVALERLGRVRDVAKARLVLSGVLWSQGDVESAIEALESALHGFEVAGDVLHVGLCLAWIGAAAAAIGEVQESVVRLEQARALLEPLDAVKGPALLRACAAHLDQARGIDVGDEVRSWAMAVEHGSAPSTWGDVRQAVRLLGGRDD
ncbi:MAG: DNA-binding winged helix-turn-helix (wHTH) protein/tetratricopeptide (TPR) repeat protein [Kiritimatiellia bacterium]